MDPRMLSLFGKKKFTPTFPDEIVGVIGDIFMGKGRNGLREVLIHNNQDFSLLKPGQYFGFFSSNFQRAKLFGYKETIVDVVVDVVHLVEGRSDALIPQFSSSNHIQIAPAVINYLKDYYLNTVIPRLAERAKAKAIAKAKLKTPKKSKKEKPAKSKKAKPSLVRITA